MFVWTKNKTKKIIFFVFEILSPFLGNPMELWSCHRTHTYDTKEEEDDADNEKEEEEEVEEEEARQ